MASAEVFDDFFGGCDVLIASASFVVSIITIGDGVVSAETDVGGGVVGGTR